jgi:hypothetical protein
MCREAEVFGWVQRFADLGVRGITLCDTTGMAYPTQVHRLTRRAARWPGLEFTLHFHNTRGMGLANVLAAVQGASTGLTARWAGWAAAPTRRAPAATCAAKIDPFGLCARPGPEPDRDFRAGLTPAPHDIHKKTRRLPCNAVTSLPSLLPSAARPCLPARRPSPKANTRNGRSRWSCPLRPVAPLISPRAWSSSRCRARWASRWWWRTSPVRRATSATRTWPAPSPTATRCWSPTAATTSATRTSSSSPAGTRSRISRRWP